MKILENEIIISIVIPTHNRVGVLLESLKALEVQSIPHSVYEVVVVADGCTDDTVEMVKGFQAPYKLEVIEQDGQGAAAARNSGASVAAGAILLFLDDDVTASPQLIEAHVKAHHNTKNGVVMGYLPPVLKSQKGFFSKKLKAWWLEMFDAMGYKGHRFSYRDLLSGNFSLPAQLFHLVGGFNTSFKCQEDYELGVRLINANAQFVFEQMALGYHNEITDLDRWLHRKYAEGGAVLQFYFTYPQLIESLPVLNQFLNGFSNWYSGRLQYMKKWQSFAKAEAGIYRAALYTAEWLRMSGLWEKLLGRLQTYWYLQGLIDAEGDFNQLIQLLKGISGIEKYAPLPVEIKLEEGLEAAEKKVSELRPMSINLFYGKRFIGHIAGKSGFEGLRSIHLRLIIEQKFAYSLKQARELERSIE